MHFLIALTLMSVPVETWQSYRAGAMEARNRSAFAEAERLNAAALEAAEKTGDQDEISLSLGDIGMAHQRAGRLQPAAKVFERAMQVDEAAVAAGKTKAAYRLPGSLNNLAAVYAAQHREPEAEALYNRALTAAQSGPEGSTYIVSILGNHASLLLGAGRAAEATVLLKQALERAEASFGPDSEKVAFVVINLALANKLAGDYPAAEALNRRALAIREKSPTPDSGLIATTLSNLGGVLQVEWKLEEAEQVLKRSLEISRTNGKGKFQPSYAAALNNLAILYSAERRFAQAQPLLEEAIGIWTEQFGAASSQATSAMINLGEAYEASGQFRQAEPLLTKAIQLLQGAAWANPADYASALSNLGSVNMGEHNYPRAEALFRESLGIERKLLGARHPRVARDLGNLGTALEARHRYADAEELFRSAADVLGNSPDAAGCYAHLGALYARQSKLGEAAGAYRVAIEKWPLLGAGPNDPRLVPMLQQYAALERKLANFASAEAAETRALGIYVSQTVAREKRAGEKSLFPQN